MDMPMHIPTNPITFLLLSLLSFTPNPSSCSSSSPSSSSSSSDYTNLVFKGCADQNFQDPSGTSSQNLKTLLSNLVSSSSSKTFDKIVSGQGQDAITGLYQCRGDLTATDCSSCISNIAEKASKLCGEAVAARIQLNGCYLRYEIAGFKQVPDTEFLYKVCGSKKSSFEDKRESAFGMLERGLAGGFYTGSYENVYVLGQCEGDLGDGDCGECVKSGVEKVKAECGDAISGQVYLQKCYVSYSYYPNGPPSLSASSSSSSSSSSVAGREHSGNTQRTVAVVVGSVAAVGFGIVCLLFARSVLKKRDNKYEG